MNGSKSFKTILMNPPYSLKWDADKSLLEDERFKDFGVLAPKSKADYAFVLHGVSKLDNKGTMAVVLPHGILFRGAAEGKIRKKLLEIGVIDGVIGLPENLFNNTNIPTVIVILKKNKSDKSVMFIDASKGFEKGKNQNKLRNKDLEKIIKTYGLRKDVDKYAHLANFDEIKENDYNLNIPRFVDTFEPEPPVDLLQVARDLHETNLQLRKDEHVLAEMMSDLTSDDPETMKGLKAIIEEFRNA